MVSAYIGAGIAQGAERALSYHREAPDRAARRKEAEQRAELSQMQIDEYKANQPVREAQRSSDLAKLESDTYNTNATLAKQQTFDALRMYNVDGDARHLNNWLQQSKSNPVSQRTTQGMTRFDKLVKSDENDRMLRDQGITDLDGFYADSNVNKGYVVGTTPDGNKALVDMTKMYAVTGYADYTTNEDRKQIALNAQLMQQLRSGGNLTDIKETDAIVTDLAKTMDLPREEVFRMIREEAEPTNGRASSQLERVALELRTTNKDLSYRDSLVEARALINPQRGTRPTNEAAFIQQYMDDNEGATYDQALEQYRILGRDERTSTQKNVEYSEEAKVSLDDMFEGDFLDADLSNLNNKQLAQMSNYVNRIEQAGGVELSNEDKKNARAIRKLRSVAQTAGEELTDEQTGPLDSMLRSVKSYVSNNVEGKDATVAYEAFRSIARNALFGSQVSGADYKAFNSAFSTLGHQTGPVLVSLRTQLQMMQDDLLAMSELNDPYVVKARFGFSLDELDNTINAVQDRIDIINDIANGRPVEGITMPAKGEGSGIQVSVTAKDPSSAPAPTTARPSLDDIWSN